MSLNKTLICSQAAFHLGLPRFTDVETETTDEAQTINEIYDWALAYLLRTHTWNFAIKRAELAQELATPQFGFTYQYALPGDFIREVRLSDRAVNYKIEQGKLLTDDTEIFLQYVAEITDPNLFDPMFAECLALCIAKKACLALTKDNQLKQMIDQEYRLQLSYAKRIDALEGTPEYLTIFGFDEARYSPLSGYSTTTGDVED